MRGTVDGSWETWQQLDYDLLDASEEMWILALPGWNESVGVRAEAEYCAKNSVPVRLVSTDGTVVVPAEDGTLVEDPDYPGYGVEV
jgi:hypothetical protein